MPIIKNSRGLERYIPANIRRSVRQRCGFGCVICGSAIIEYHHFDPPYAFANEHRADGITLLCPSHHASAGTRIANATIVDANGAPKCIATGFASDWLDIGKNEPYLQFLGVRFSQTQIPIQVNGIPFLQVKPPEQIGGPFRITATLCDSRGAVSLRIKDNEWIAYQSNWDVQTEGSSITIREASRHISLRMLLNPPNGITIDVLDMYVFGWRLRGQESTLFITDPNGGSNSISNSSILGGRIGLSLGRTDIADSANDSEC